MQHGRTQTAAGTFGDRRKAEMPGFGLDARQFTAKRAEESEPCRIGLQPFGKRRKRPARRELLRRELYLVSRCRRMTVAEIDIRAPGTPPRPSGPRPHPDPPHPLTAGPDP